MQIYLQFVTEASAREQGQKAFMQKLKVFTGFSKTSVIVYTKFDL